MLLFHGVPDVPEEVQRHVLRQCAKGTARFVRLASKHFEVPSGAGDPQTWALAKRFSVGYRHMIRFFTVGIWPLLEAMNYTHVMRLDEDSFIWSPIYYNIFEQVRARGLEYAFRLGVWERGMVGRSPNHFHDIIAAFAKRNGVTLNWLQNACVRARWLRRHDRDSRLTMVFRTVLALRLYAFGRLSAARRLPASSGGSFVCVAISVRDEISVRSIGWQRSAQW